MSIQAINSSTQAFSAIKTDFKTFGNDFSDLLNAQKTGTQDQAATAENTLLQAIQQLQSDFSASQQQAAGGTQNTMQTDFQSLSSALQAVSDAKKSGTADQITTSEDTLKNAMQQFQTDISGIQKGHGHHHHKHQDSGVQNSMQTDLQNLGTTLKAALDANKSGNQDQITSAQDALQKAMQQFQTDISGTQSAQGNHHHHHWANAAYANTSNLNTGSDQTQTSGISINIQA